MIPDVFLIRDLAKCHRVSIPDGSVLHLASRNSGHVLTGDRRVRRISQTLGLTVRGVLWILDTLVAESVIPKTRASSALQLMIEHGARLPLDEVQARLENWC